MWPTPHTHGLRPAPPATPPPPQPPGLAHLVGGHDLAVGLLHTPQPTEEVPARRNQFARTIPPWSACSPHSCATPCPCPARPPPCKACALALPLPLQHPRHHRGPAGPPCAPLASPPEPWHSPELALRPDGILSPHLHAVHGGVGLRRGGVVAAHHLVLVELEATLRPQTPPGPQPPWVRPGPLCMCASWLRRHRDDAATRGEEAATTTMLTCCTILAAFPNREAEERGAFRAAASPGVPSRVCKGSGCLPGCPARRPQSRQKD